MNVNYIKKRNFLYILVDSTILFWFLFRGIHIMVHFKMTGDEKMDMIFFIFVFLLTYLNKVIDDVIGISNKRKHKKTKGVE